MFENSSRINNCSILPGLNQIHVLAISVTYIQAYCTYKITISSPRIEDVILSLIEPFPIMRLLPLFKAKPCVQ